MSCIGHVVLELIESVVLRSAVLVRALVFTVTDMSSLVVLAISKCRKGCRTAIKLAFIRSFTIMRPLMSVEVCLLPSLIWTTDVILDVYAIADVILHH